MLKNQLYPIFILVALFTVPSIGHAQQVLISEVAWMGTDEDANNEWIELYNFSNEAVDLEGWTLSDDGSLMILLSGVLSPHGVGVLERTDDDTIPGTAFLIYTGALPNSGGTLTLKDADGVISDQAVGGEDWLGIGGNNTVPKMTPQRTRTGSWVTGVPTPNAENVQEDAIVATTTTTTTTNNTTTTSTTRSSGGGSAKASGEKEKVPKEDSILKLSVDAPKIAYVNQEVSFRAVPSGIGKTLINSLTYTWNFGDTYTARTKETKHVFTYPGEYIVIVEATFAKQKAYARLDLTVLPVTLELSRTDAGDIMLKNTAPYEVDVSGYTLQGDTAFVFPKYSFIKSKGELIIPERRIGHSSRVALSDTQHMQVASYAPTTHGVLPAPPTSRVAYIPRTQTIQMTETTSAGADTTTTTTTTEPKVPEASTSNEATVIRIGGDTDDGEEKPGMLRRLLSRVFDFFRI